MCPQPLHAPAYRRESPEKAGRWWIHAILYGVVSTAMIGCTHGQGRSWGTSSGSAFRKVDDGLYSYSTMVITRDDHVCVVIAAARGTGNQSSGGEGRFQGTVPVVDGTDVRWTCVIHDASSGTATINDVRFELAKGGLFLVTNVDQNVEVQQIKIDAKHLDALADVNKLFEVMKDDPEMAAFRDACRESK